MATRLLGAKLNLLAARDVLNARDQELSDGGGLLLRSSGGRVAWVFRYTNATGKRREMGLGACPPSPKQTAIRIAWRGAPALRGIVHDRMPVIVQPKDYERWLDPENEDVADILATPPSEGWTAYPVGRPVNSPKNDDAKLIEAEALR